MFVNIVFQNLFFMQKRAIVPADLSSAFAIAPLYQIYSLLF